MQREWPVTVCYVPVNYIAFRKVRTPIKSFYGYLVFRTLQVIYRQLTTSFTPP